jgi:hypothetical protein
LWTFSVCPPPCCPPAGAWAWHAGPRLCAAAPQDRPGVACGPREHVCLFCAVRPWPGPAPGRSETRLRACRPAAPQGPRPWAEKQRQACPEVCQWRAPIRRQVCRRGWLAGAIARGPVAWRAACVGGVCRQRLPASFCGGRSIVLWCAPPKFDTCSCLARPSPPHGVRRRGPGIVEEASEHRPTLASCLGKVR